MATAAPGTSTMAAATTTTLDNPDYINWIRAGLGLVKLKIILTPATERILKDFHAMILRSAPASATPGCTCTFADIKWGKTPSMKTNCNICSHFVTNIMSKHKYPKINKDNCEPCKWASDWFEVAKAYMGPGMKDNNSVGQSDCSNIILLWEQCAAFHSFIQDLTLLKKVRDSRNTLMHSASLTLTDAQMKAAFQEMLNLLKDTTLSRDRDVDAGGVTALEKIRDQGLRILPEDELAVWLDLVKSQGKSLAQLEEDNKPVAEFLKNDLVLLKQLVQEYPKLEGRVSNLEGEMAEVKGIVSTLLQEAKKETAPPDSEEVLRELRRDLADHYTEVYRTIHPIPLVDLPLQDVLIPVSIKRVTRTGGQEKEHRSIDAKDIMTPTGDDARSPKLVLVEGMPGQGKSLLSQSLAHSWAKHVHSSSAEATTLQSAASQSSPDSGPGSQSCIDAPTQPKKAVAVHKFAILIVFIVHKLTVGDFSDNLILLLTEKWQTRKDALRKCLQKNYDQVLVIFDGYDEAASPQPDILTKILAGELMRGCTIITTSRPGFCKSVFDVTYRLEGFDSEQQDSYVKKYMSTFYNEPNHPRQQLLLERLQSAGTVSSLCENPLFLVLVCIIGAQGKKPLPDRRTELYQQFDEFMCKQAARRAMKPGEIHDCQQVLQRVAFTLLKDNLPEITLATIDQCTSADQAAPGPPATNQIKYDTSLKEGARVMTRLCHVGFVAQGQHLQGLDSITTAHFIHQSFVDYFAAKHITSASEEQQTTLIEQLFKHKDIFHHVFVFIAGLAPNADLLAKLLTRWWRAMAAERMPTFNSSDLKGDMESMGSLTHTNHALHHAPLDWLAETPAACSALQVLASHTQLKAIYLGLRCTETCLTAVKALCKAAEHQPTPRQVYLGVQCTQFKVCDVIALLQAAAQSRGAIVPVYLWLGLFGPDPVWTEAECRSLAALLAQLKQIREIVIQVRGCSGLEALSRGFTAGTQLQDLTVACRPGDDEGGDHALPEFRSNVQLLSHIEVIRLLDFSGSRVSRAAESELERWGREHGVTVVVHHSR